MPELTPDYGHQQCNDWNGKYIIVKSSSNLNIEYNITVNFSEKRQFQNNYYCNCPNYKFKKMKDSYETCKHIKQVKDQFCDWASYYSDESQTEEQKSKNICPRCGQSTIHIIIMV